MKNPRITAKERGLIKGALRRAFSRSELRNKVSDRSRINHFDSERPRVKKWAWCELCGHIVPHYTTSVDHISPIIPVDSAMEYMTADELVNNIWCEEDNLQNICEKCHDDKTSLEREQRTEFKRARNIAEGKVKNDKPKSKKIRS